MSAADLKIITFDLGNVLVKVDHLQFCRRLADLAGISPQEVFAAVFGSDLEPSYDTGRLSSREFYEQIQARFRVSLDFDRFVRWWTSIFAPLPEMAAVVTHLAQRYPLFLLSNTNALHFQYIQQEYPILEKFTHYVLSFAVGHRKPEPEIYQHLIEKTGAPAEQILFIDDKLPFVLAAREQGLQAWQFTGQDRLVQQLQEKGLW